MMWREFDRLEPRLTTGINWSPWTPIDITGIMPDAGFYVAGQVVEFSILGTGEDWDKWSSDDNQTGGQVQDIVTITWSGASCQPLDGGKRALCTLGSAGVPDTFHIVMSADDSGITPAGDFGSADDPAVVFAADVAAVWVTIGVKPTSGLNPSGTMDVDDTLAGGVVSGFPGDPRALGPATTGPNAQGQPVPGLWERVELTGDVAPHIASAKNGLGRFDWRQTVDRRTCVLLHNGDAAGSGIFKGEADESPLPPLQTNQTSNWKVFMLDAPGGPQAFSGADYAEVILHFNFTTWVNFKGVKASDDYQWHITMTLRNDGSPSIYNYPGITVGPDFDYSSPPGQPPANTGSFPVDCSEQVW